MGQVNLIAWGSEHDELLEIMWSFDELHNHLQGWSIRYFPKMKKCRFWEIEGLESIHRGVGNSAMLFSPNRSRRSVVA